MDMPPLYFYSRQSQAVASAREGYLWAQRNIFSWNWWNYNVQGSTFATFIVMAVGKYPL